MRTARTNPAINSPAIGGKAKLLLVIAFLPIV
jgi:hypothetical protein